MGNKYIISRIQMILSTATVIAEDYSEAEAIFDKGKLKFEIQYDGTQPGSEEIEIDCDEEAGFFCPKCLSSDALSFEGPDGIDISENPFCVDCSEHVFMEDK